jgi:hypothetical protein
MRKILFISVALAACCLAAPAQDRITVNPGKIINHVSPLLYGSGMEDVNHEVYGGIYNQRIFGESFEEGAEVIRVTGFTRYDSMWHGVGDYVYPTVNNSSAKLMLDQPETGTGKVAVDLRFESVRSGTAGLFLHASNAREGAENIKAYEFGLSGAGNRFFMWKVDGERQEIGKVNLRFDPWEWHRLEIEFKENSFKVSMDGELIFVATDHESPITKGQIGLRTRYADASFRNLTLDGKDIPLNRESEFQVSSMWRPLIDKATDYSFALDREDAYNGDQCQVVENRGSGKVGVTNMSLNHWGIGVRKGQVFKGDFFAKGEARNVWVALQDEDGTKEYARVKIGSVSGGWNRYSFTLKSEATDSKARFAIFIDGKGMVKLDQVTLMGTGEDLFKGYPIRADIAKGLIDEGLTFLRYGGSMTNAKEYSFKQMTGPRDRRQPYRGQWYHFSTNGFGIVEFLQVAEACGFTPSFAINMEEDPETVAFMVEYLNGPADSNGGRRRVADGHPKPYGVKYIELGNEECIFWTIKENYQHYVERFNLLADAMLKVDPTLQLVCSAWWRTDLKPLMEMVFKGIDGKAAYWDLHTTTDSFAAALRVDGDLDRMKSWFLEWNPDTKMRIAIFEENGATHNVERMLGHVVNQNAVRRHGDWVLTSSAANALEPYLQNDNAWNQGQVFFTPDQVWGMPPFHAQKMASSHHQGNLVETKVEGGLDVTATVSDDGNCTVIHMVNLSDKEVPVALSVKGFEKPSSIKEISLSGGLKDVNSPTEPLKIAPVERKVDNLGSIFAKPYSYTLVEVRK